MDTEDFWINNLSHIIKKFSIIPRKGDTLEGRLNSLTRLSIIISICLYAFDKPEWLLFSITSISLLVIIYLSDNPSDVSPDDIIENYKCRVVGPNDKFIQIYTHSKVT